MIKIKYLEIYQILVLNNLYGIDMVLKKIKIV